MTREYRIALQSKTPSGFENYAEFYIGNDYSFARKLFGNLQGSNDELCDGILLMELREMYRGLPLDIQVKRCTLDQVAENCKIITKEIFRSYNLRPSPTA